MKREAYGKDMGNQCKKDMGRRSQEILKEFGNSCYVRVMRTNGLHKTREVHSCLMFFLHFVTPEDVTLERQ